jgi:hypothetical protein
VNLFGETDGHFCLFVRDPPRKTGVTRRIQKGVNRLLTQVRGDPGIGCQELRKGSVLRSGGLRYFVHNVMSMLPPNGPPKFQHNGLGTDQAPGEFKIGSHALWIEP